MGKRQHPFTGIVDEDLEKLESAPWEVRSKGYDLVLNGNELGSGSIRIHRQASRRSLSGGAAALGQRAALIGAPWSLTVDSMLPEPSSLRSGRGHSL